MNGTHSTFVRKTIGKVLRHGVESIWGENVWECIVAKYVLVRVERIRDLRALPLRG
jgi:hypothetical protein